MRLMNSICDDEDYEFADQAEDDLHCWALGPFNPIFDQIEPAFVNQQRYTLQDFLYPETFHYSVYAIDETLHPCLNYEVPRKPLLNGVGLNNFSLCSTWRIFRPTEIESVVSEQNEMFSKSPRKVFADGKLCFLKFLDRDDQRAAIREMTIYKSIEILGLDKKVKLPRMYGVVEDKLNGRIVGLLLSWINCRNKTLACALGPETSSTLRAKWDLQLTTTLNCLNEAGIVWGDVKPANILIDEDEDAWIIDFGGGYTQGWVGKDQMETTEGDKAGLLKIKELLRQTPYEA
ncbi:hypothetical protein N7532_008915 [Penicillium argentinense]|uniref:Protein kinase domain-containing protein n=1 Tax=Penicillium argentinense TaxID=1131581 RepID=A0A9W9EYL0_9EURO|nr:uncharacterized protein N7532_008915 [Penicillium argentinense]KAJ5090231.1 hypothetical protein N7532_008915 [Penicillium argentinense]